MIFKSCRNPFRRCFPSPPPPAAASSALRPCRLRYPPHIVPTHRIRMEYVTSFRDSALKATDSFRGIERTDSQDSSALDEITEGCPQLSYRQVSVGLLILGGGGGGGSRRSRASSHRLGCSRAVFPTPFPPPRLAFHRGPHSHRSEERFPHMMGPPVFFRERTSVSRRAAFAVPLIPAHTMVLPSLSLSLFLSPIPPTPPGDPNPAK